MSLPNVVARLRLVYHLNMLDVVNALSQVGVMSDDKANNANKNHLKQIVDCYERLGYKLPDPFIDFKNEGG